MRHLIAALAACFLALPAYAADGDFMPNEATFGPSSYGIRMCDGKDNDNEGQWCTDIDLLGPSGTKGHPDYLIVVAEDRASDCTAFSVQTHHQAGPDSAGDFINTITSTYINSPVGNPLTDDSTVAVFGSVAPTLRYVGIKLTTITGCTDLDVYAIWGWD